MTSRKKKGAGKDAPYQIRLKFAKAWNDYRKFPTFLDLTRYFQIEKKSVVDKARRYRLYLRNNPKCDLPSLIMRHSAGGLIPIPEEVLQQLDVFRYDTAKLKKAKGVVVTSAQFGAPLAHRVWKSLLNYCEFKGYELVVLPIKYGAIQVHKESLTSTFPDELKDRIIFENYLLPGGDVGLNVMRMRPTLERFLTDGVCKVGREVSQIFAAPKMELEHRPRIGHNHAKAIMTTGTCTHPNYSVDKLGQSDRTGEVAMRETMYGGIVVEFGKDVFHYRQLVSNKKGEFYDIDYERGGAVCITPDGVKHEPDAVDTIILGDYHNGRTCPMVRKATFEKGGVIQTLKPNRILLHDFFDGESMSWHDSVESVRRSYKHHLGYSSLLEELEGILSELRYMQSKTDADIHVIPSNHNEFLAKYVQRNEYMRDDENMHVGHELWLMMSNDLRERGPERYNAFVIDPLALWIQKYNPKVHTHHRQETLEFPLGHKNAILCSLHTDIGAGGINTRSIGSFSKFNTRVMGGHTHSGQILNGVWKTGVMTPLLQSYIKSPATSWTNTHGVIFENAQRQLIGIILGKWHR